MILENLPGNKEAIYTKKDLKYKPKAIKSILQFTHRTDMEKFAQTIHNASYV